MGKECGDHLFDNYADSYLFFQYDYELFPARGGDTVCAERHHHSQGTGNGECGGHRPLQRDGEGYQSDLQRGCETG